jgi:hypothetical protein
MHFSASARRLYLMNFRSPVLLGVTHSRSVPVKPDHALEVPNIDPNVTEANDIHHCPEYFSDFTEPQKPDSLAKVYFTLFLIAGIDLI